MKTSLFLFFSMLVIAGCSSSVNPVDELIGAKSPDEIFEIFGRSIFDGCLATKPRAATGECRAEITDGVAAARKNGYGNVSVDNFTPEVLSRFLAKLSTSHDADNTKNIVQKTRTRYD